MRSGIVALAVVVAACSSSTTPVPPSDPTASAALLKKDCADPKWKEENSRTLVLSLPSTVALVIARRPRLASAHQAQNFLKHSLPEPSSALQSAAVALELGVI